MVSGDSPYGGRLRNGLLRLGDGDRAKNPIGTIKEQRLRIRTLMDRNPSLNPLVDETIAEAYPVAVIQAASETSMVEQDFPRTCPYSVQEILNG